MKDLRCMPYSDRKGFSFTPHATHNSSKGNDRYAVIARIPKSVSTAITWTPWWKCHDFQPVKRHLYLPLPDQYGGRK